MNTAVKRQIFENYIAENLDSAYRFAYTYMKNVHDAEDIVSESVLRALNAIVSLREPKYVKVWFYRIIANTALTALKRKGRCLSTDFEETEFHAEAMSDDYSDIYLEDILGKLPEKYRAPVVLKVCEGMTFSELAAVLGLRENTAKTRFYKALEMLREKKEELL